ncbi:MAG: hypothetical protein J6Y20_08720 [Lachnospiraceae bacterium]|nr:hypothetical protein [Lachnospiraceae bacterium]
MEPVREFLESAKWAHAKAARLSRKIEQLTTQVEHITPSYSGMPGGGSTDVSASWAALAQLRSEYMEEIVLAERREKEVSDFINSLPIPEHRAVLLFRYCDGLRWPSVIEAMQGAGYYYSDRQVFRLHGRALSSAREKWREVHEQARDIG